MDRKLVALILESWWEDTPSSEVVVSLKIDTDPCQLSLDCNSLWSSALLWAGLPQRTKNIVGTNLDMASLLNNLEAADNNTKEPDPTNVVDEGKMVT